MRRFLASNSLAILLLIAIKNSQRESREGQGGRVHQSSFCPGACGWLSPALKGTSHWDCSVYRYTENIGIKSISVYRYRIFNHTDIPKFRIYRNFSEAVLNLPTIWRNHNLYFTTEWQFKELSTAMI
jgi:hypothetical protein